MGVNLKLMVFNPAGERGKGEHYVLANPKIISTSKSTALEQEACLSFKNEKGVHVEGDVEVWPLLQCAARVCSSKLGH